VSAGDSLDYSFLRGLTSSFLYAVGSTEWREIANETAVRRAETAGCALRRADRLLRGAGIQRYVASRSWRRLVELSFLVEVTLILS
jgi:hypothetical protein